MNTNLKIPTQPKIRKVFKTPAFTDEYGFQSNKPKMAEEMGTSKNI